VTVLDHGPRPPLPACFAEPVAESIRFADLIAGRPGDPVFVACEPGEAAALRDYGLVAVARPQDGRGWSAVALRPLLDRDVVLVGTDPLGHGDDWARRDAPLLGMTARTVKLHVDAFFTNKHTDDKTVAGLVASLRHSAIGPAAFADGAAVAGVDLAERYRAPSDAPTGDGPPPVPPFPVAVLSWPTAHFIRAVAASIGCPEDLVALPCLVIAAGPIGRSVTMRIRPDHLVHCSFYGMNVGPPASGKSPALAKAARPLRAIDQRLHEDYETRRRAYDAAREDFERATKSARSTKPEKPPMESVVIDDVTVEAVAPLLARNPRGLTLVRDEGSAWLSSFDAYRSGRGGDRAFWLAALYGNPVRVDRKGHIDEPIRIPHPFLCVVGNMTVEMLGMLRESKGRDDGFLHRLLFAFPDPTPRPRWNEAGIDQDASAAWLEVVEALHARPLEVAEGGQAIPRVVGMTREAKATWTSFYDAIIDETNAPGYNQAELASETKLVDFTARFSLELHLLDLAGDPEVGPTDPVPDVSRRAVEGAIRLFEYFRATNRRVRWYLAGGAGDPDGERILAAMREHPEGLTRSQIRALFHGHRTRASIDATLGRLAARGLLRESREPTGGRHAERWAAATPPAR
jgi:hypothetical protein